jgi:hypothetical protein
VRRFTGGGLCGGSSASGLQAGCALGAESGVGQLLRAPMEVVAEVQVQVVSGTDSSC